MQQFHTAELAQAAGVHPNTVRRYEARGALPPVPRAANGYRIFTPRHLDCLRLARMIVAHPFPGRAIQHAGVQITQHAAASDWAAALDQARIYLALIQAEQAQAETAALLLERWATSTADAPAEQPLRIGQVAHLLGLSIDVLRNWERNGLLLTPRNPNNRYRAYGPTELSRLRVIRVLTRAGYSHMAILRMLLQLDRGFTTDLRHALDTPGPDEDAHTITDRWLSTLAEHERHAQRIVAYIAGVVAATTSSTSSAAHT